MQVCNWLRLVYVECRKLGRSEELGHSKTHELFAFYATIYTWTKRPWSMAHSTGITLPARYHYVKFSISPPCDVFTLRKTLQDCLTQMFGITAASTHLDVLWVSQPGSEFVIRTSPVHVFAHSKSTLDRITLLTELSHFVETPRR